jgi:hypothetical protein
MSDTATATTTQVDDNTQATPAADNTTNNTTPEMNTTTQEPVAAPAAAEDTAPKEDTKETPVDDKAEAAKAQKELEAFNAKQLLLSISADQLLEVLYKDPESKESKEALGKASAQVVSAAAVTCSMHFSIITESAGARELPAATVNELKKTLGETKKDEVLKVLRLLMRECQSATSETLETYSNLGPVYAGVPLGVDFGLEFGVQSGEGEELQRTGLIFGIRCDHMSGRKPARKTANKL